MLCDLLRAMREKPLHLLAWKPRTLPPVGLLPAQVDPSVPRGVTRVCPQRPEQMVARGMPASLRVTSVCLPGAASGTSTVARGAASACEVTCRAEARHTQHPTVGALRDVLTWARGLEGNPSMAREEVVPTRMG